MFNVRNFTYRSSEDFDIAYYNRTFDLNNVEKTYLGIAPFGWIPGSAHTFASFKIGDKYVSVSVEARREIDESYGVWKSFLPWYELMYVVGDERDVVGLRAFTKNDTVVMLPLSLSANESRDMFIDILEKANTLREEPEYYNIITNTCTTNLIKHINDVSDDKVPFSPSQVFPKRAAKLTYEAGIVDTDLDYKEAWNKFLVNNASSSFINSSEFSHILRE